MFMLVLAFLLNGAATAQLPTLVEVKTEEAAGGLVITFRTTEAAVPTQVKRLEDPERLYFDIPGFLPGQQPSWSVGTGPVRRVRAALNQAEPPRTRVVIELTERRDWHVEPGASPREFRLVVERAGPSRPKAIPSDFAAAALKAAQAATPALPPAPPDERTRITRRLFALTPALDAMRTWSGPADAELVNVLAEAEALAAAARVVRVTGAAEDLL
ncbi:MAG: AMIN domain-containing protein, partial [Acidobacteriota bacterium]|nr:AMIN domain-containing protein [Acidobacteriota bacterium]